MLPCGFDVCVVGVVSLARGGGDLQTTHFLCFRAARKTLLATGNLNLDVIDLILYTILSVSEALDTAAQRVLLIIAHINDEQWVETEHAWCFARLAAAAFDNRETKMYIMPATA